MRKIFCIMLLAACSHQEPWQPIENHGGKRGEGICEAWRDGDSEYVVKFTKDTVPLGECTRVACAAVVNLCNFEDGIETWAQQYEPSYEPGDEFEVLTPGSP